MPLEVLLPMVVVGIAGITLILHVLGLSRPARLADEAEARAAWLDEFAEDKPMTVTLSRDGRAALVKTSRGRGVVWPMGADTTARYLDGARVLHTQRGLRIDLPDYTAPRIHLTLDASEADMWSSEMERAA